MLVPTRRCPPCKAIAPEIEKLSAEEGDAVVFLKVDVDKAEDAAADNGISAMPTFILFKEEKKVTIHGVTNLASRSSCVLTSRTAWDVSESAIFPTKTIIPLSSLMHKAFF